MPDRSKTRPRDPNELAHRVFLESIGELPKTVPPEVKAKNPAAVALGRLGGLKGGVDPHSPALDLVSEHNTIRGLNSSWQIAAIPTVIDRAKLTHYP